MTRVLQNVLQQARHRLDALYGERLVSVVLYGSHARDEAQSDSDIDVLVVLQGPVEPYAEIKRLSDVKLDLLEQYHVYVSFQPFSEHDYRESQSPFMINVRAEGIEL